MHPSREDLAYKDEESEEEQPLPLVIRGNDGHQEVKWRRHPENWIIIHNRAIGDINTTAGEFARGGESNSARRNHARSLSLGEIFLITRLAKLQKKGTQPIVFTDDDFQGIMFPYDDALVVTLLISNYNVHKVLIDTGSSMDNLFMSAFEKMAIDKGRILLMTALLVGFGSDRVRPMRVISLLVITGFELVQATIMIDFILINKPSAYHAIIERPALNALRAVVSTTYLTMKFLTKMGIGVVRRSQEVARFCFNATLKEPQVKETLTIAIKVCDEQKLC
jgi:hypothetical protein